MHNFAKLMSAPAIFISYSDTAVIIPAYNPSQELLSVCADLVKEKFSVFVVNDGSEDNSIFARLSELPVIVIHHPVNLGQGAALETGIRKAIEKNKNLFVTFDADGQHAASSVADLLGVLAARQADIVFGSRFLNRKLSYTVPVVKRLTLKLGAMFDGLLTGIWLTDSHNGLRAFNRKTAEAIHFTENRMAHASEILWLTKKYHWKYAECGVMVHYGNKSQHPSRSIEIAIDLFLRKLIS
jgi:glycosyltransferase involved in cell wall biosynthesis